MEKRIDKIWMEYFGELQKIVNRVKNALGQEKQTKSKQIKEPK